MHGGVSQVSRLVRILAVAVAAAPAGAFAAGWFNMPTAIEQCFGYGYGAGYHAPLLLGQPHKAKIASQRIVRLPAPLTPPPAPAFTSPSYLPGAVGYGHQRSMATQSTPASTWRPAAGSVMLGSGLAP